MVCDLLSTSFFTSWPHEKKAPYNCAELLALLLAAAPKGRIKKATAKTARTNRPATFVTPDALILSRETLFIIIVSFSLTKRKSDGRFYDEETCLLSLQ